MSSPKSTECFQIVSEWPQKEIQRRSASILRSDGGRSTFGSIRDAQEDAYVKTPKQRKAPGTYLTCIFRPQYVSCPPLLFLRRSLPAKMIIAQDQSGLITSILVNVLGPRQCPCRLVAVNMCFFYVERLPHIVEASNDACLTLIPSLPAFISSPTISLASRSVEQIIHAPSDLCCFD